MTQEEIKEKIELFQEIVSDKSEDKSTRDLAQNKLDKLKSQLKTEKTEEIEEFEEIEEEEEEPKVKKKTVKKKATKSKGRGRPKKRGRPAKRTRTAKVSDVKAAKSLSKSIGLSIDDCEDLLKKYKKEGEQRKSRIATRKKAGKKPELTVTESLENEVKAVKSKVKDKKTGTTKSQSKAQGSRITELVKAILSGIDEKKDKVLQIDAIISQLESEKKRIQSQKGVGGFLLGATIGGYGGYKAGLTQNKTAIKNLFKGEKKLAKDFKEAVNDRRKKDDSYSEFEEVYAKGGDLYEYRSGNYEILIWETEEHREHLGPDRIFPKGTTDEEVISEAKGLFEDFASVEVEKNGEVIYHISNDRPKGKKFENGGHISKHPIRANNSSLLRYANFQDGSHINLLQLTPRLGGLTYKNPYKFAVSVSSIKKGQIVTEFITLKEAEKVFEKSVGTRGAKTPLIDMQYDGYVNEPFAQGGSVYDRSQDRAIEGNTSHINSNKEEIDHYGLASSDALELAQENEDTIDNMRQGTNKVLNNLYEKNPSLKYKKGGATPSFSIRKSFYNETIGSNEKTGTGEDFRTVYFMIGQDGVSQNVLLSEAPEDYEFEVSEEVYVDYTDSSGNTQKAYMEANSPDEVVRTLRDNHNAVSIERARMEWEDDKKISDYKKI